MIKSKLQKRISRHTRIRAKISGTAGRPRLIATKSLTSNYAQLIDDTVGKTLLSASDAKLKKEGNKTERAKKVGLEIAKKALEKGIKQCVFDRNGYKYHGRIKALADGAREGGLKF